ncbi:MAG TPA: ATP-binding protein, partial [Anaerolineales bacterium]|nr:ATP-binding protein [Anaerolineales bacterium]
VNPAFTALTGYPAAEALHQPVSLLRSGRHDDAFYQNLWNTIKAGKIWRGEIINRRKDGTHYIESQTITPLLNEKGEVYRFISIKQDVTELINTRDQALEASRFKSELLARVSHELRTPLGAIIGYTELLHSGLYGALTQEQKKVALEVVDSAKHLTQMVNELLEEAQLDARAIQIHAKPFSPAKVLQTLTIRMGVLAQNKGLTLTTALAPELPDTLIGDPARLQQILINLIGNAIKFTPAGTIAVRMYPLDATRWAIDVQDTGPGIPLHAQQYIFEPFRQVDGTMTREHGGTGLGLSIAKRLTELMGGEISLMSEIDQGSTFTVLLPLHIPETNP